MESYAMTCPDCPWTADCRAAFGRFWADKSDGGRGCRLPFTGWGIRAATPKRPERPVRPKRLTQGAFR